MGRHGEEMEERGGGSGMLDQNQRTGALGGPGPSHPSSNLPGRGGRGGWEPTGEDGVSTVSATARRSGAASPPPLSSPFGLRRDEGREGLAGGAFTIREVRVIPRPPHSGLM